VIPSEVVAQCKQWNLSFGLLCDPEYFPSWTESLAWSSNTAPSPSTLGFSLVAAGGVSCRIGRWGQARRLSRRSESHCALNEGQTAATPLLPLAAGDSTQWERSRVLSQQSYGLLHLSQPERWERADRHGTAVQKAVRCLKRGNGLKNDFPGDE